MFSGIRRFFAHLLRPFTRLAWGLRWFMRLALLALIVDAFYLAVTWPDWAKLATGPVPKSNFMLDYEQARAAHRDWPPIRWQPVPIASLPKTLTRAVILAEDSRFYEHSGLDLIAFREAMEYNWMRGRLALGASTISQQTVKNLFLTRSRDPLRKWHELILTWGMEQKLSKRRILELYLNVAEFGRGLYGVQAAAHHYFGVDASALTPRQAVELITTLPSPVRHNPANRSAYFERRSQRILALMQRFPGEAASELAAFAPPAGAETALPLPEEELPPEDEPLPEDSGPR